MKYWIVFFTLLLVACGVPQSELPIGTQTPTSIQASETSPVSIVALAQTSVSNTNYLRECITINPSKLKEQIPYQNVWPGKTKESELEFLLGVPDKKYTLKGVTNWVYGDMGLLIEKGIVTDVLAPVDEKSGLTLEQLVLTYGCPDIVFVVNTSEDYVGYSAVSFVYHSIGMDIRFSSYPASLTDIPSTISYFQPMGLQEYLKKSGWTVGGLFFGKPIEWSEAVK